MAKLNTYVQYYYNDDRGYDDCDDCDDNILKQAFVKLCEQSLTFGKKNYNHYILVKNKINMYTNKISKEENAFYRVG